MPTARLFQDPWNTKKPFCESINFGRIHARFKSRSGNGNEARIGKGDGKVSGRINPAIALAVTQTGIVAAAITGLPGFKGR